MSTVALVAGMSLASAQGLKEGTGAADHGASGASSQSSPRSGAQSGEMRHQGKTQSSTEGAANHRAAGERQMNQGRAQNEKATSGQAGHERQEKSTSSQNNSEKKGSAAREPEQRSTTGQGTSEKSEPAKSSANKEESKSKSENKNSGVTKGRNSAQGPKNEKSTTGQASSSKNERSTTGQSASERNEGSKAQSSQEQPKANQPAQTQKQTPDNGKQNQTTGATTQGRESASEESSGSVRTEAGTTVNAQQQTKIKESVLSAKNAPRVEHVNFAIRTNTVVPSHVHVAEISTFPILVETFPRYRDDSFFVVEDKIVIVDRSHRIVDVVPVGSGDHFGRAHSTTTTTTVELSEPEIRQLQQVLIERGFYHGRVDGKFGPEMREAVISFQRKEGFEATGKVDSRTVNALGISGRTGQSDRGAGNQTNREQSGSREPSERSGTTGQGSEPNGRGHMNAPTENRSQSEPATGQKNNSSAQQRPDAKDHNKQSGSMPSTTGQGSAMDKEPTGTNRSGSDTASGKTDKMQSQTPAQKQNPSNK